MGKKRFSERHPYLFWQLWGWGILFADFIFFCVSAFLEFGEWCYPIIVFSFIIGIVIVLSTPIVIRFKRKKLVPGNDDRYWESFIRGKIGAVYRARGESAKFILPMILLSPLLFFGGISASFPLVEINVGLGFASLLGGMILSVAVIFIFEERMTKDFYKFPNGDKYVDIDPIYKITELYKTHAPAFVFTSEPSPVALNFFYNWVKHYLKETRLTMYCATANRLCEFPEITGFSTILEYADIVVVFPKEQFDLTGNKEATFRMELAAVGGFTFSQLVMIPDEQEFPAKPPSDFNPHAY